MMIDKNTIELNVPANKKIVITTKSLSATGSKKCPKRCSLIKVSGNIAIKIIGNQC